MEHEIRFGPSQDATNYVSADIGLPWGEAQQFAREFKQEVGDSVDVRLQVWAGPYELIVAAASVAGATGGLVAGACAALDRWAARHPETTVTIDLDDQTTVTFTGKGVPPHLQARIDDFFSGRALPGYGTPVELQSGEDIDPEKRVEPESDT